MNKKDRALLRKKLKELGGLRPLAKEIGVAHGTVYRWLQGYNASRMGQKVWNDYKAKVTAE